MKNYTAHGILIGLGLALAIILGGAGGFLLALVLGGIGAVVGAHLDGRINHQHFVADSPLGYLGADRVDYARHIGAHAGG